MRLRLCPCLNSFLDSNNLNRISFHNNHVNSVNLTNNHVNNNNNLTSNHAKSSFHNSKAAIPAKV